MKRVFIIGPREYKGDEAIDTMFTEAENRLKKGGYMAINSHEIFKRILPNRCDWETLSKTIMYRCDAVYKIGDWHDDWLCEYQNKYAKDHDMPDVTELGRAKGNRAYVNFLREYVHVDIYSNGPKNEIINDLEEALDYIWNVIKDLKFGPDEDDQFFKDVSNAIRQYANHDEVTKMVEEEFKTDNARKKPTYDMWDCLSKE